MALDGNTAAHDGIGNTNDGVISETALDWFHRSQRHTKNGKKKRRRRNGSGNFSSSDDYESSDSSDVNAATDPSMAAWRFLRFGKSGIAPIDAAWKRLSNITIFSKENRSGQGQPRSSPSLFPPPVTVLEGPKDVGKTWMLLTLAARFVVATRASRFKDFGNGDGGKKIGIEATSKRQKGDPNSGNDNDNIDEDSSSNRNNDDRPKVLLLDSTYDFSVLQLVSVVRLTLMKERQRQRIRGINQRERQSQGQQQSVTNNEVINNNGECSEDKQNHYQHEQQRNIEEELDWQQREKISLEQDMEDCLSRIHIIQVDNGPTGWVPMLEALTYQLSEDRRRHHGYKNTINNARPREIKTSPAGPPTLLLWDGFLSDMALSSNAMMAQTTSSILVDSISNNNNPQVIFDSPSTQELLMQLSRLLQREPDALWLVLTTRTVSMTAPAATSDIASDIYIPATIEQSGIGLRLTEWIRKEEERRQREKDSGAIRERQPRNRYPKQQPKEQQRASCRICLDRRYGDRAMGEGYVPSTTAAAAALFARVVGCGGTSFDPSDGPNGNHSVANDEKIPYSISLGGILS